MRQKGKPKGKIFVISGPSGSGKTTLLGHLLRDPVLKRKLAKSVSLTTRPRRSMEKNSRDYFFISEKEFQRLLKAKKILEWTKYLDYYYATPKDFVERETSGGRHLALCLDRRGALAIKRFYPRNTVAVFIRPPSLEVLCQRIAGRCPRTKTAEIKKRLELAKKELRFAKKYDYCLVNKNLTQAVRGLKEIILREIATAG